MLFSTTAGAGHFGPLAPIARACAAAGHKVRVAAPVSFADQVESAGLVHTPFADVPPEVIGPVFGSLGSMTMEDANATVVREIFGRLDAQAALPGVGEIVSAWRPDVIVREPCEFASLAVAEREGISHVEVAIGMGSMIEWARGYLSEPLAELDILTGLERGRLASAMAGAPVLTSVPASVDTAGGRGSPDGSGAVAPAVSEPRATWRYRDVDGSDREGSLPGSWGDPDAPLVYVTFGSVTGGLREFNGVFRPALDALADLPVRVLLTTGRPVDPESLRPWPDNALVQQWWPQEDVMPLASAMVGHGGFGTTLAALAAGVPQAVVPLFGTDQAVNAAHVQDVGAGLQLDGGLAAVGGLASAVSTLLEDAHYRAGAAAVAAEIASLPSTSEIVGTIERLAAGG
ncbi:glycosyltransferase [Monashia sp. NPDC004114]